MKWFKKNFYWAVSGIIFALKTQANMRFHLAATVAVIALGLWLKLTAGQWLAVLFAISLVWLAELLNTAVETVVNLVTEDYHPLAKAAKDVAAGAVLIAAVNSLLVAAIVFLPKLLALIR